MADQPTLPPEPTPSLAAPSQSSLVPRTVVVPSVPASVQVLDKLGEIVGVVCATYLASTGKVSGDTALIAAGVYLGVNQGLRQVGNLAGGRGAGLGIVGLGIYLATAPHLARVVVDAGVQALRARGHAVLPLVVVLASLLPS